MEYKAGKAKLEKRVISAQEWWKLNNWREISKERGTKGSTEIKSNTGWLWNSIVNKHADAMASYPEPVILPRTEDDKEEAKKLSDIVPVVMELNGFEDVYSQCQWQKLQEGTAVYGVFWDTSALGGLGDVVIKKVNILNLFWQPGISDIQESKNVFYVTQEDNDVLEQMYPQLIGKLRHSKLRVSKYIYDDHVKDDDKSLVIDWYYHKYEGSRKILHMTKFVGHEVLFSTEKDPEMSQTGLYSDPNACYPFIMDALYPVEGSPAGMGYIHIAKDTQTDIDTLNQAMVQNAVVSSTPRNFIRNDGSINEDEFADWSKPFVHVDGHLGQDSIMPIQIPSMSGNALNMLTQKIDELKSITGNTDVQNGQTPSGVTAASAIAALQETAGRSSMDSNKAAYRSYRKIVTMVIERIRQFYDLPRQFRILGSRGEEQFVQYNNAGIQPQVLPGAFGMEDGMRLPVFDIDVRAQRENAYTKVSQNELALQFYQLGMLNPQMIDQTLICIDLMDFKGKEELVQKLQQMGGMQQMIMQLAQIAMKEAQAAGDQQTMMELQGILGQMGMAPAPGMGAGSKPVDLQEGNALSGGQESKENGMVRKARERAASAGMVD